MTSELDRRAAAAVSALDRALGDDLEVPPFDAAPKRPPSRVLPLLLAAAVIVVALVGLALSRLDGGDDQSTVAGETDTETTGAGYVRLALAEPLATGHQVAAAFDGRPTAPDPATSISVQAPADAEDPWAAAVLVSSYAVDPTTGGLLYGEMVDLGGVDATVGTGFPGASVSWIAGNRRLGLNAPEPGRSENELVDLARLAVEQGWMGSGPLPGYQVLRSGDLGDVGAVLAFLNSGDPVDLRAIGYRSASGPDFAVGTAPGGDGLYRTLLLFADDVEPTTVRGSEAVIVTRDGLNGLIEIYWRENEATVGRAETFDDPDDVIALLDGLTTIDAAEYAALAAEHPVTDERRLLDFPPIDSDADGEPISTDDPFTTRPDTILAELDFTTAAGNRIQSILYEGLRDGLTELGILVGDERGSSGTGTRVRDLTRIAITRSGTSDGLAVYAGVAPGEVVSVEISVGDTDTPTTLRTTSVGGADATLFAAWSDAPAIDTAQTQIVRVTLADGRVLRFAT